MILLMLLLACRIGLSSPLVQAQADEPASGPALRRTAIVMDERGGTAGGSAAEKILSGINEQVVREMEWAWRMAGGGVDEKESVLLLFRMRDGAIEARHAGVTNEQKAFTFKWNPAAVAIFHTHPNTANPQPSSADRKIADALGVPIFTLTARGMYVYDPGTKKVTMVRRDLDWLNLSKGRM